MGAYINKNILYYFIGSVKNLVEGKSSAIRFSTKKIKVDHLNLDSQHRAIRIMTKRGYLSAKKEGAHIDYSVTPKGMALYDSVVIFSMQL